MRPDNLEGSDKPGIAITLHGDTYPAESGVAQSLTVNLLCSQEASEPTFVSYENGAATVEWPTLAACAKTQGEDPPLENNPNEPNVPSGSGLGWFFLL